MLRTACLLGFFVTLANTARAAEPDAEGIAFFEKKIRPVLVKKCYACHSAKSKEPKGGLLLDTRAGIRSAGDSGHAVVPGNVEQSLLLSAIRFEDLEMPPDEQLPESVIADFEKWIKMGAPDPRNGESAVARKPIDFDKAREFWSFQPIQNPQPPPVKNPNWPRQDIDRFVLARIESAGLAPVADANPHDLIRRVYFDLIGLPPTPEQVSQFVSNPTADNLASIVDRLLDSRHFGERWGRHWLDVVRYGESTGMERNFTYPYAWRYRDYVIKAFNEDKPFDRFVTEQVAGDLLEAQDAESRHDQVVATGLLALGPKSLNSTNREQFVMDVVDEQIDVTTQAFLGFTAACARCHDHKFDPIPTKEYYSLAGIFCSTDTYYGTGGGRGNRQAGGLLAVTENGVRPVRAGGGKKNKQANADAKKIAIRLRAFEKRLPKLRKQAEANPAAKARLTQAEDQIENLKAQLRRTKRANQPATPKDDAGPKATLVMGVRDASNPADTQLRIRGEAGDHGDTIPRGFLTVLAHQETPAIADGSGRLEYARWLAARDNPLTARVFVNRVWQHLFGRGIVSSVNNFGVNGGRPTHPELLDHLATRFVDEGWSVKSLIRSIVTSRVYQLSSEVNAKAAAQDPHNNLLWRMNQRRLEAEAIRDAILAAAGRLDPEPAKGSIVQSVGDGDIGRSIQPARFATGSVKRSVYLPIVRSAVPEVLQVFDFPDPSIIFGQREVTTVPTQALYMMNSPFVIEQTEHFARRLLADERMTDDQRLDLAYQLAFSRHPSADESVRALDFIERSKTRTKESGQTSDAAVEAWAGLCHVLYASSEFRYLN